MKAKLILLLVLVSCTLDLHAFYNPSTGRWLNRDPLHELSFFMFLEANETAGIPDLNEYQFVANNSINYIDKLGGGILCECGPGAPTGMPIPQSTIIRFSATDIDIVASESNLGTFYCTDQNQGQDKSIRVMLPCNDRLFSPKWCCAKKTCKVQKTFTCRKNSRGLAKWYYTSYLIVKNCP